MLEVSYLEKKKETNKKFGNFKIINYCLFFQQEDFTITTITASGDAAPHGSLDQDVIQNYFAH